MASASLIRPSGSNGLYVCARCAFRAISLAPKTTKRGVGTKYLAKVAEAKQDWDNRAREIQQGNEKSILAKLEERGLVHTVTGSRDQVDNLMTTKRLGAYVGIDPTAPSLHVGHMLPLMSLFWMYVHGYHAVTLVGGATAKIGDPTDRLVTREDVERKTRTQNTIRVHYQLKKLWVNVEAYGLKYGYKWDWSWRRALVNNNSWMNKLTVMELLQILGPGVRIGPMLGKDTVKNKMEKGDGMSFAEFTYPLLQAWDWWHMYKTLGIRMQIGGSDQYGNITAGIDAVKYIAANHPDPDLPKKTDDIPFGFTVPLLTTSSGAKFGKSAGNAIWLDEEMTSTYDLYKYFLRTSDEDAGKYLKLFTFMPIDEIETLIKEHMEDPSKRIAQHKLASEFVELVHGKQEAVSVKAQHQLMFQKPSDPEIDAQSPGLTTNDLVSINALENAHINLNNRPKAHMKLPRSLFEHQSIGKILMACGLADSASEGHRLARQQAVHISGRSGGNKQPMLDGALSFSPVKPWKPEETRKFIGDDDLVILRRGKHNIRIIDVVDDEEYKTLGLSYPGMPKSFLKQQSEPASSEISQDLDATETVDEEEQQLSEEELEREYIAGQGEVIQEYATPEARIEALRRGLEKDQLKRQRKMDKKLEPKGRFIAHKHHTSYP